MKAQAIAVLPRLTNLHPGSLSPAPGTSRPAAEPFWRRLVRWNRVARERRRLMELDAHILKDIGLTPEDAYREASRSFWDVDRG